MPLLSRNYKILLPTKEKESATVVEIVATTPTKTKAMAQLTKKVIICVVPVTRDTMVHVDFFQVKVILAILLRRNG